MRQWRWAWPSGAPGSLLAALTTWVALWSWAGFVESPSGYLIGCLGACLLVAVSGTLLRVARLPSLLVVPIQLALLVVWMNRSWAADATLGGWLPTAESMARVGDRIQAGVQVAQSFRAPVPDTAPDIHALLIVAGAGTAVLVDFLACGLRRAPVAGLPLLAVYTAPVRILEDGVPWWTFAACALAFLFLIADEESRRLARWGRQLSRREPLFDSLSTEVSTGAVRASARKIGFTATGMAVLIPILVPTLGTSLFAGGGNGVGGDGDAVAISNPIVDLRKNLFRGEDLPLVYVDTRDRDPSYLRISVLDSFDGQTWRPSGRDIPVEQRADGRMPRPPGLEPDVPRTEVPYGLQITEDFESFWLPTPYPISTIDVAGDWRYATSTLDIISAADDQTTQGIAYTLSASKLRPDPQDLATAAPVSEELFSTYTALPDSLPDSVRELARRVTEQQTSRFEQAVRLQDWFRDDGGFTYSLDRSPGTGVDDLVQFLRIGPDGRVGYCEQFAAAMSVMGRSIGIPSRVAIGFLRPDRLEENSYVYSSHDLHAWPEMYFEGTGWVRFEPTPSTRAASVPQYTSQGLPSEQPSAPEPSATQGQPNRIDRQALPPAAQAAQNQASDNRSPGLLAGLAISSVLLLGLTVPRLTRSALRRGRWARAGSPVEVAEAAWCELRDSAVDLGVAWDDSVTLRVHARSLVGTFGEPRSEAADRLPRSALTGPSANPEATAALERLVAFVERARYARSVPAAEHDIEAAVRLCVAALRDGSSRSRGFRATWAPASLLTTLDTSLRQRIGRRTPLTTSEPGVDRAV